MVDSSRNSVRSEDRGHVPETSSHSLHTDDSRANLDAESSAHVAPTEGTPLLAHNVGTLEPVDPLNQRYARIYRAFLVVLFISSLLWVALLSIDILISVGVSPTQGSGFELYAVSMVSFVSIGITVLFYQVPSPSDRALNLFIAALLFIDMLIISISDQLRHRIGPIPMLIAFGGAALVFLLISQADTVVQHAKEDEQERLYGHTSNRRSILEWVGLVIVNFLRTNIVFTIILLTVNLTFDASDSHISVGTLVPIGGTPDGGNDATLIHISCTPSGMEGPVALIEAGSTSGEDMHAWVQRARGLKAVCYWDRPGFGLSDNAPSPIGMDAVTSYFLSALEKELPSYRDEKLLLVSHGVGSLYSRVFAAKIPHQLAGFMFIDGLHEELFYQQETAWSGFKEFITGAWQPLGIGKFKGVLFGQDAEDRLFGLLDYTQPRVHKARLQEQVSASRRSALDISLATGSLQSDVPLLVVSSSEMSKNKEWSRYQRLLLKLSENAVAWKIIEGPHNLWWNGKAEKELITQLEAFINYIK